MDSLEKFLQQSLPETTCAEVRREFKMTQEEWAVFLRVPLSTIRKWEQNVSQPSPLAALFLSYLLQKKERDVIIHPHEKTSAGFLFTLLAVWYEVGTFLVH